jgi:hypothetical protein
MIYDSFYLPVSVRDSASEFSSTWTSRNEPPRALEVVRVLHSRELE